MIPGIQISFFDIQLVYSVSIVACDHHDHHLQDYRNILDIDAEASATAQHPLSDLLFNSNSSIPTKTLPQDQAVHFENPPDAMKTTTSKASVAGAGQDQDLHHMVTDDPRFGKLIAGAASQGERSHQAQDFVYGSSAHAEKYPRMHPPNHSATTLVGHGAGEQTPLPLSTLSEATSSNPAGINGLPTTLSRGSTQVAGCTCTYGGIIDSNNNLTSGAHDKSSFKNRKRDKLKKAKEFLKSRNSPITLIIRIGRLEWVYGENDKKKKNKVVGN